MRTFIWFFVFLISTIHAIKGKNNCWIVIFGGITVILFLIMTNFLGIGSLFSGSEKEVAETAVKAAKHSDKWDVETFWTWFYCIGFIACIADIFFCDSLVGGILHGIVQFFLGFRFLYPAYFALSGAGCYGMYKLCGVFGWLFIFIFCIVFEIGIFAFLMFVSYFFFKIKITPVVSDIVALVFHIIFMIFAGCFI